MNRNALSTSSSPWHRLVSVGLLVGTLIIVACSAPPPEPPAPPEVTYDTRGIVRKLPPGGAGGDILIAHEAIQSFADQDGKTVGMPAMTMPFHVATSDRLTGVAVGDRVGLTFGVRWSNGPPLEILVVEPLGPDVRLDFEKEEPEAETEAVPESE